MGFDYDFNEFGDDNDCTPWDDAPSDDPMPDKAVCDPFTAMDAFFIGGLAMGLAYEEGIDEGCRRSRKRKRKRDGDDDFI